MPGLNTDAQIAVVAQNNVASQTILAEDGQRQGATVYNNTASVLYLLLGDNSGAGASSTVFTLAMAAQSYYEVPFEYLGIITGIWAAAGAGTANVTSIQ